MFKRDIIRLLIAKKLEEANYRICQEFHISMAHSDDIIRELERYQWHARRIPGMDDKIRKILNENPKAIIKVVKMIREATSWGLLECKWYMEDVTKRLRMWPTPRDNSEKDALLEAIFGKKR